MKRCTPFNPATNEITISGIGDDVETINVIDISGRAVLTKKINPQTSNFKPQASDLKLQTRMLSPGIYFIELTVNTGKAAVKFIKE